MYRNLKEALDKFGLKSRKIAELIQRTDSYVSKKINGSSKSGFSDKEIDTIFSYFKNDLKYEGSKSDLFEYTEINFKRNKVKSLQAQRIDECIKEKKLTNKFIADKVGVEINTISSWRNGNVQKHSYEDIDKLAEILDVVPSYLMGKTPYKYSYSYKDYYDDYTTEDDFLDNLEMLIIEYQKFRGYDISKEKNEEVFFRFKLFIAKQIDLMNNRVDSSNFKKFKKEKINVEISYLQNEIARNEKMIEQLNKAIPLLNHEDRKDFESAIKDLRNENISLTKKIRNYK